MDNDYSRIDWPEVRKGDLLMHENGDRLTVRGVGERISVAGLSLGATTWQTLGFLPHRRKPEIPTQPGAFHDKDGELCVRQSEESAKGDIVWWMPEGGDPIGLWQTSEDMEHRAPFTRLVPMPTEEQIEEALLPTLRKVVDGRNWLRRDFTAAVMALLNGEGEDK